MGYGDATFADHTPADSFNIIKIGSVTTAGAVGSVTNVGVAPEMILDFVFPAGGTSDHGGLTGLADDDHTQYALLAGRSGGQTLIGGTASGNLLTLQSTSHATKGAVKLGTSYYDEVNNRFGIANIAPFAALTVTGTTAATSKIGWAYSNTFGQTYITAEFSSGSQNSNTHNFYISQIGGTGTLYLQVVGNLRCTFFGAIDMNSANIFSLGTSTNITTAPALGFNGDINTGIGHPSGDVMVFVAGGAEKERVDGARITANVPYRLKNYTVATLPAGAAGDTAYVTDALGPAYMVAVVGGGAVVTPVFYNGAAWVCN